MGKENKTVYVILGLLNHESLTGYDIKKRIDSTLSYFWETGFGQIYPTLALMEKNELVSKRKENKGKKLEKIIYSITDEGRKKLIDWLSLPVENEYVKYEILLKLFFGSILDTEKNIENINAFKEKYSNQLPVLRGYELELKKILPESPDHLYFLLTVLFGQKIYNAYIEWADEAIKMLKDSEKKL